MRGSKATQVIYQGEQPDPQALGLEPPVVMFPDNGRLVGRPPGAVYVVDGVRVPDDSERTAPYGDPEDECEGADRF